MESVFAIGDPEHRQNRRAAQRNRRSSQDTAERDLIREQDSSARRVAQGLLDNVDRERIRTADTLAHTASRNTEVQRPNHWWEQVSHLNSSQVSKPLGLRWNRICRHCGITILTGERCHDECFVCGPKGSHVQPLLPPYPEEWDYFIHASKTAALSRKFNQIFCLTALGVYDGDFMKFSPGVSAVTLAGGRTYHRILPSHEGQHALRWFIHDPVAMFAKGDDLDE
ncbi:hypothetical protein B0H14DRAFT_2731535 [Mycena olivaceomarginata]|nr:hypothetical protein B0H14DRAFT_2731535 [Mycena olivaceomarginata]